MKPLEKVLSGRFLSTLFLVATYCLIMGGITANACRLLTAGKDIGKDLLIFVVGNFSGTAIGAVIAYFFKKTEENGKEKQNA